MASVKSKILLPAIFIAVFALSRIPHVMPNNFSVAYAFAFCAGVFFQGRLGWWLPLAVIFATDMGLNFYYQFEDHTQHVWSLANLANLAFNYVAYAVLILLGRCFKSYSQLFDHLRSRVLRSALFFVMLIGGSLLGAILFYLI